MKAKGDLHLRTFTMLGILLCIMVLCIAFLFKDVPSPYDTNMKWVVCIAFLSALFVIIIIFSRNFNTVETDEIGFIKSFGKPVLQAYPGYIFTFKPFYRLVKIKNTRRELYYPEAGDFPNPIRIIHGVTTEPTSDPLDNRLTTSIGLVVSYKIVNYISFVQTIGNHLELRKQIGDKLINEAAILCAQLPLAANLIHSRREEINNDLTVKMNKFTALWGIHIFNAQLQDIDLGNEIDIAQKNLSVSEINTVTNRNNAKKILYEGTAHAEVQKAFLFAKGEGLNAIAKKLGIDNTLLVLQLDTLSNIYRKSPDLNIYGNNFQQLFNTIMETYKSSATDDNSTKEIGK